MVIVVGERRGLKFDLSVSTSLIGTLLGMTFLCLVMVLVLVCTCLCNLGPLGVRPSLLVLVGLKLIVEGCGTMQCGLVKVRVISVEFMTWLLRLTRSFCVRVGNSRLLRVAFSVGQVRLYKETFSMLRMTVGC